MLDDRKRKTNENGKSEDIEKKQKRNPLQLLKKTQLMKSIAVQKYDRLGKHRRCHHASLLAAACAAAPIVTVPGLHMNRCVLPATDITHVSASSVLRCFLESAKIPCQDTPSKNCSSPLIWSAIKRSTSSTDNFVFASFSAIAMFHPHSSMKLYTAWL